MTTFEQFVAATERPMELSQAEIDRMNAIQRRVRGYSSGPHYAFFKTLLAIPEIKDVLILGVYHGRDIAFMRDCLEAPGPDKMRRDVRIVGVDRFTDESCADWPADSAGKRWEDAGYGRPPQYDCARGNIGHPVQLFGHLQLVQADDAKFLSETNLKFDAVYLDTSHDYETVARQLAQVSRVCRGDAIICGDDYSDESPTPGGSWGVIRAVSEAFTRHDVFAEWIWISSLSLLKTQQLCPQQ